MMGEQMESLKVMEGDVIEQLRTLPDESVHCCVTSPPYWGLRQYLFDNASVIRKDLSHEKREWVESELKRRGIKPKM